MSAETTALPRLGRAHRTAPKAPVRIVHIGIGAFAKAHQAFYTDVADPRREWGIAAFTGRGETQARILGAQDGLFTLVERHSDGDRPRIIESVVEVHPASDLPALAGLLARPQTAVVTITVTEAGYHLTADGVLDEADPAVAHDIAALAAGVAASGVGELKTAAARLVVGLAARREAGAGPIAIVSCDNLPGNGAAARAAILGTARGIDAGLGTAQGIDAGLAAWIDETVSFVDTSVDRITPRQGASDIADAEAATGYRDEAVVVAEPYSSWVLSGDFPAGRPEWELAGASFVPEITPFERRKLWLLNGAHTLLAAAGRLRGHDTVSAAMGDPRCVADVEAFWDEAAAHLDGNGVDLDPDAYRAALRERFLNPRIVHHLEQIGTDAATKVRVRLVPVFRAERAAGRSGAASATAIAAWAASWLDAADGQWPADAESAALVGAVTAGSTERERIALLLDAVAPGLSAEAGDAVSDALAALRTETTRPTETHQNTQKEDAR